MRNFSFILLLLSYICVSQNPYHITVDQTSGLPSNSVYDVFQDSKGFMWFATSKGLCRFDGTIVKTFTNNTQTSKSGSSIQEDNFGRIWYENFDGFLYYIENNTLKLFEHPKNIGYYRFGIIGNSLFVLQKKSVNIYNLKTLKLKKKIDFTDDYFTFSFANKTHFYILNDYLYEIDKKGNRKKIALPENFKKEFSLPIIQQYKDGIIICSKFNNKYITLSNDSLKIHTLNFPIDFIQNVAIFDDEIWFCSPKGLLQIDSKKQISHFFKSVNISYLYKDKEKNYWASSLNEGVFFIENFDTKLYEFDKTPNKITSTKQTIIFGTDKDEIYSFDIKNNTFQLIFKGDTNHEINQLLFDNKTKAIFFTSAKFRIFKDQKLQLEKIYAIKDINRIDEKYVSFAATNNSGLIATNSNLKSYWDFLFEKNKDSSGLFFNNSFLIKYKNGKSTVFNPINNTIYYATNGGLIAQNTTSQKEIKYKNNTCFFVNLKYFQGKVYALSTNEEIFVIDSKHNIHPFKLPNIFVDKKVEFIKIQEHFLYVFFANEILECNLLNNTCKSIISARKDIHLNDISLIDYKLYIATSKGILVKNSSIIEKNNHPKLLINNIFVNDSLINLTTKNSFLYRENNLKIDFSIVSFSPNQKNVLSYKINDSKWYQLESTDRKLNLYSLSPGTYNIKLKLNQSANFEELTFTIKNPFWKTPLFIGLILLLCACVIYFYYQRKLKQIQKKNQLKLDKVHLEKNLNQSKLKAIKSQMNPHFFYNALNTLQSYILSNDKKQAVEYLSKFSNLTRTILEATENDFITIREEINTLKLYLEIEKARFEDDFIYEITLSNTFDIDNIKIPTLLLQPYVENAVKHGLLHKNGRKKLEIHFEKKQDIIEIMIDDNGIGRKKSAELNIIKNKNHISFASEAMQNRIELLNKATNSTASIAIIDKTSQHGQASGTLVILKIPVNYSQ